MRSGGGVVRWSDRELDEVANPKGAKRATNDGRNQPHSLVRADGSGLPALTDFAAALDLGVTGDQEVVHPV
jgi:hypothetical protein